MDKKTYIIGSSIIILFFIINIFMNFVPYQYIFPTAAIWVIITMITEGKPPSTS